MSYSPVTTDRGTLSLMGVPLSDLIDSDAVARLRAAVDPDAAAAEPPAETKSDAPVAKGMEHKADPGLGGAQVLSADDETGLVTALVSVTGIEDNVKDIIEPGAYTKTMAEREPIGVWSHDDKTWVARTEHAVELMPGDPFFRDIKTMDGKPWPKDAGAVKVDARFNLETPHGKAAFSDVKFFQGKTGWSIGYRATKAHRNPRTGVRHIKELAWYEYSPVMVGAASQPMTLAVKSMAGAHAVDADDDTGLVDDSVLVALEPAELKAYAELRASLGLEVKDVFTGSVPGTTTSGFTEPAGLDGESKAPGRAVQAKFLPCPKCKSSKVKMDDKGKAHCADCGTALTKKVQEKADDELELKDHVRTAQGARRYGQPIGTEIVRDKVSVGDLKVGDHVSLHLPKPGGGSHDVEGRIDLTHIDAGGGRHVTVDGEEYNLGRHGTVDVIRAAGQGDAHGQVSPVFKRELAKVPVENYDAIAKRLEGLKGPDAAAQLAYVQAEKQRLSGGGKPDAPAAAKPDAPAAPAAPSGGGKPSSGPGPGGYAARVRELPVGGRVTITTDQGNSRTFERQSTGFYAEVRGNQTVGKVRSHAEVASALDKADSAGVKISFSDGAKPDAAPAAAKPKAADKWGPAPDGVNPEAWKVANDHSLDGLDAQGEDRAMFQKIAEKEGVDVHDLEVAADAIKQGNTPAKPEAKPSFTPDHAKKIAPVGSTLHINGHTHVVESHHQAGGDKVDVGTKTIDHRGAVTSRYYHRMSASELSQAAKAGELRPQGHATAGNNSSTEKLGGREILKRAKKLRDNPPPNSARGGLQPASMTDHQLVAAIANAPEGSRWHTKLVEVAKRRKKSGADDLEFKLAHEDLNRSPKVNWVERAGQLPAYVQHIAKDLHEQRGMPLDQAIPIAISRIKVWAAGGDNVKPDTRAKAVQALAEWEALKAKSHAKYDSDLLAMIQHKAMTEAALIESAWQVLIDTGEVPGAEVKADDELDELFDEPVDEPQEKGLAPAEDVLDMLAKARELKALVVADD